MDNIDTNLGKHLIIDRTLADFCDAIGINPEEALNDFLTKVDKEQREPFELAVNTQRPPAQDPTKIIRTVDQEECLDMLEN